MSEDILGRVSAFADGECSEFEVRAAVASLEEPVARAAWSRYQLIGDAVRGDLPHFLDSGLPARVSAAIASEPAILAPPAAAARPSPWLRPVAGMAIAATVAAVAVIGVGGQRPGANGAATMQMAATPAPAADSPALMAAAPAFVEAQPTALPVGNAQLVADPYAGSADGWMPVDAAVGVMPPSHSRLNSYIMHYSEQRTMLGSPGMLPYAKVVGYSPDR